ncbi:hypothetical protein ACFWNE_33385 [Streptomyces goshikiensis]|uniref:hypothetical protein n=1 Tax=Streptomyces goshikiensis TaxID=1942 RepID=UPI003648F538
MSNATDDANERALRMLEKASRKNAEVTASATFDTSSADMQEIPEVNDLGAIPAAENNEDAATGGIQQIPAQIQVQESPTVAVARDRIAEAIGREAVFLADQRAGQASEGLEALARAFALVATPGRSVAAVAPASIGKRDLGKMGYDAYQG